MRNQVSLWRRWSIYFDSKQIHAFIDARRSDVDRAQTSMSVSEQEASERQFHQTGSNDISAAKRSARASNDC